MKNWELVNFCEFDKYATKSYCAIHNVDESKNLGDITKVDETKLEPFNMICGGSPCQDFSIAGKQKGSIWTCKDCGHEYNPLTVHWSERDECPNCHSVNIEKTRSSLLVEYLRVIRANKPSFGIYENVKNIVGKQFKETTFRLFTEELEEYGYNVYWKVLNAKNYGIPQNRERVYLIFIKKELDNGKFKFPEPFDSGLRVVDILEKEVDEKYYINNEKATILIEKLKNNSQLNSSVQCCDSTVNEPKIKDISNCITARYDAGIQNQKQVGLCVCENNINKIGEIKEWHQRGTIYDSNGVIGCLAATDYKTPKLICEQRCDEGLRFFKDNVCGSLRTIDSCRDKRVIDNNYSIRKLTPKECWRLMGFDDEDIDKCIEKGLSNSQLYKQAGNSIVVDVLYYILSELYKAMPYLFDDLKLSSFFSGIGAFEKALDRLYKDINNENFTKPQMD